MANTPHNKKRLPARRKTTNEITNLPPSLQSFAWNLPQPLTEWGRAYLALQVLEAGNKKCWKLIPPDWFNLAFAKRHGRAATKRLLAEIQRLRNRPAKRYPKHK
jgi:hypothetical protein